MGLPAAEQAEKSGQLYELRAGSSPHALHELLSSCCCCTDSKTCHRQQLSSPDQIFIQKGHALPADIPAQQLQRSFLMQKNIENITASFPFCQCTW